MYFIPHFSQHAISCDDVTDDECLFLRWLANLEKDTFIEKTLDVTSVQNAETIPKLPISPHPPADSKPTSSRIGNNESLHGSSNVGEKSNDLSA